MKYRMRRIWILATLIPVLLIMSTAYSQQIPAFPGAEGYGSTTVGGRGGQIIEVTNLNDRGAGSFRDAVMQRGARIVVFRVGGTINLNSSIHISNPYITIAGQTAPGGGICLAGFEFVVNTHDVIVRGLRIRLGGNSGNKDALRLSGSEQLIYNVIIDHCSISWGVDESASTYSDVTESTFSWNIISEALYSNSQSFGLLLAKDGPHTLSVHHNLFAHNRARSAKVGRDVTVEFVNNIVYNYGDKATTISPGAKPNIIGNYYIPGPSTTGFPNNPVKGVDLELRGPDGSGGDTPVVYVADNIGPGLNPANDWSIVDGDDRYQSNTPAIAETGITVVSPEDALTYVLDHAGAVMPVRDAVDARVVEDVKNGTGKIISSQTEVGGWPVLAAGTAPADSDHDGMPDAWETAHGLNPNNASDANGDLDGLGYTNIEKYINELIPDPLGSVTSVSSNNSELPDGFALHQNYPNPFNPTTSISYNIPGNNHVELTVHNSLGQVIATLVDDFQTAGSYTVQWNGSDENGSMVASGLYFYRLRSSDAVQINKMMLLK